MITLTDEHVESIANDWPPWSYQRVLALEVQASRKKLHAIEVQLKLWESDPDKNCYHDRVLRAILGHTSLERHTA